MQKLLHTGMVTACATVLATGLSAAVAVAQTSPHGAPENAPPTTTEQRETTQENRETNQATDRATRNRTGSATTGSATTPQDATGMPSSEARGGTDAMGGSERIRVVQQHLQERGHYEGEVDGIAGPMTRRALLAYQRAENLTESGRLDAETQRALGVGAASDVQAVSGTRGEGEAGQPGRAMQPRSGQPNTMEPQAMERDGSPATVLRRGSQVRRAQEALERQGYHRGAVDGILGPVTQESIRQFQRANEIEPTGQLDVATRGALGLSGTSVRDRNVTPNDRGTTGTNQAGADQPRVNQPGATQPGINQPGINQPGINQPGSSVPRPGTTQQPVTNQPGSNPSGSPSPGAGDTNLMGQ